MPTDITPRNQYATAALKEQRAIVAGELAELEGRVAAKREALEHLDAVLRMFAPNVDPEALPIRRRHVDNPYPVPGLTRRIRDVLRRRGEPMATPSIVQAILAEMAYPPEAAHTVANGVRYALRNLALKDASVVKEGRLKEAMWSVRRQPQAGA